jgi:hypothetical protein
VTFRVVVVVIIIIIDSLCDVSCCCCCLILIRNFAKEVIVCWCWIDRPDAPYDLRPTAISDAFRGSSTASRRETRSPKLF